jgi:hypothetical protein
VSDESPALAVPEMPPAPGDALDAASVAVVQTVAAAGSTPEGDGTPNLDVTISSVQVG